MTKEILIELIESLGPAEYQTWLQDHNLTEVQTGWEEAKFKEFWDIFPQKTRSGRVLRPVSTTAKRAATAFTIFKREIKSDNEADLAIQGLKREIIARRGNNGLEYINNLETYLRNKNFELYYDEENEIDDTPIDLEEGSSFNIL